MLFLTESEMKQLDAIFARILPADHTRQIPGAIEAKASRFVSQLLAMEPSVYFEIPIWRTLYRDSLAALDAYCKTNFNTGLVETASTRIDELLSKLETGNATGLDSLDQKILFMTFRRHCIQGCFADPRWGGNDGKIMWRALGYMQAPEDFYHE